ncbi:MAG: hypothetical protein M1812_008453 [Candelaria pacifica]|nr:MAG: hypothetical protein M1812_008453 [Candelaria pacifica]
MLKDTFKEAPFTMTEAGASYFEEILGQTIFSLEKEKKEHGYHDPTYLIVGSGREIGFFGYKWEQKYILDAYKYKGCVSLTHSYPAISGTFFPLIDTSEVDGVKLVSQNCEDFGVGDGIYGVPFVFNLDKHEGVSWPEPGPNPRAKPPSNPRPRPPPPPAPEPPRPMP